MSFFLFSKFFLLSMYLFSTTFLKQLIFTKFFGYTFLQKMCVSYCISSVASFKTSIGLDLNHTRFICGLLKAIKMSVNAT